MEAQRCGNLSAGGHLPTDTEYSVVIHTFDFNPTVGRQPWIFILEINNALRVGYGTKWISRRGYGVGTELSIDSLDPICTE